MNTLTVKAERFSYLEDLVMNAYRGEFIADSCRACAHEDVTIYEDGLIACASCNWILNEWNNYRPEAGL